MKNKGMTKMRIPFNDGYVVGENLWVTILNNDNYRIENNPVCGFLFFHDIVKAIYVEGELTYQSLVIRNTPPAPPAVRKPRRTRTKKAD